MNLPLELIFIIIIVLFIVILYIIYLIVINTGKNTVNNIPNNSCDVATNTVPDISNSGCCFVNNSPFKFISIDNINYLVGDQEVYYLEVCKTLCTSGTTGSSNNLQCSDQTQNKSFNSCVSLLKPKNCNGRAMPIAANGTQLYYANYIANNFCNNSSTC